MKKIKNILIRSSLSLGILFILTTSIFIINSKKVNAQAVVHDPANTIVNISKKIQDQVNHIKDYINLAQQLANTYKSTKALVQQVTNTNLTNFAVNVSSDQILTYGQTALNVLAGDQGSGTNVNTNGDQVITNLKNYTDKVGVNEIRKALQNFTDPTNQTPFSDKLKQQLVDFTKNIKNIDAGKLVTFALPYIARDEICNDTKLKDIIKNGEPADYINARKAVANVDIDKACQSPNIMSPRDQAVFVSLAKAGYGGNKTQVALTDPNNTESSVIGNTIAKVIDLKDTAEDVATKQTTATNLVIGQQSCFDKNGKPVNYDLASANNLDKICYSTNSTPDQSGSIVKDRTAAALLSPYISMLARSIATTNQTGNCKIGKPGNGDEHNSLPNTPGNPSHEGGANSTPNAHDGYNNTNPFKFILSSIFQTAEAQDLSGITKTLGDISSTVSNVKGCISLASNLMNTVVGVLNIGGANAAKSLQGLDNPYSRLADSFDSIVNGQNNQSDLYAASLQSQQDYQNGATGYTVDDLKNAEDTYKNIREINTDKLNDMVFTYAFVNLAIANSKASLPSRSHCFIFCGKKKDVDKTIANVKGSVIGLQQAAISLNNDIKSTIKDMAKNNYKEQQINKLYDQFKNSDSQAEDNQDSLQSVLGDALTTTDYANLSADWNYTPQFPDLDTDPSTITEISDDLSAKARAQEEARQSKALLLPEVEKEGPYSASNLDTLRLRAWKIFQRYLNTMPSTDNINPFLTNPNPCFTNSSTLVTMMSCNHQDDISAAKINEISDLLARYGMSQVKYLDPNLPRAGRAGVINVLAPDQISTWSELSFCNNLGLATTVCDASNGINLYQDYTNTLNDGILTDDQLDDICIKVKEDVNQVIDNQCLTTNDPDLLNQCTNQKPLLIQQAQSYCVDPIDNSSSTATSTP